MFYKVRLEYCHTISISSLVSRTVCLILRSRKLVMSEYWSVYIAGGDIMRGLKVNWYMGCFHLCFVPQYNSNSVTGYKIVHKELIVRLSVICFRRDVVVLMGPCSSLLLWYVEYVHILFYIIRFNYCVLCSYQHI
jgi:hypothetical protein